MQAGVCWEVYVLWFTAQLSGSVIQAMYMTCTMPSYAPVPRLRYFFFCVFISTVPQSKKLKIKHRFISGKIIHKCRVLNCNVWLSEGSHPEAHSIRFWITFLKLDYGIWWMSLKNMHYSYFRMTANIIYFHSSVHSPCGFEPKVWNTPFYGSIHEQNDGKP